MVWWLFYKVGYFRIFTEVFSCKNIFQSSLKRSWKDSLEINQRLPQYYDIYFTWKLYNNIWLYEDFRFEICSGKIQFQKKSFCNSFKMAFSRIFIYNVVMGVKVESGLTLAMYFYFLIIEICSEFYKLEYSFCECF